MVVAASLYDWLLFVHIVAAMVWVGGTVVLNLLVINVLRSGDHDAVVRFVSSLRVIGPAMLAPATLAVIGLGAWLVADSDAWSFGQRWIVLALVLVAAAFLVGAAFLSRAAVATQRAAEAGDAAEAARRLRQWAWGSRLILLLLLVAVWDMVFKPG